jgi:hypothetical protein
MTMVEVLISVTIISLALLPILYVARRNMETTRIDRVRVAAEAICHNTLERFGRGEDNVAFYLQPAPGEPNVMVGRDLWSNRELARDLGAEAAGALIALNRMRMEVKLTRHPATGLDLLYCRVYWHNDRERQQKTDSVAYARYIVRDHLH